MFLEWKKNCLWAIQVFVVPHRLQTLWMLVHLAPGPGGYGIAWQSNGSTYDGLKRCPQLLWHSSHQKVDSIPLPFNMGWL